MKRNVLGLIILLIMSGCTSEKTTQLKIGVLQWAEHPALTATYEGLLMGLEESGHADTFEVILQNANEDASAAAMIADSFVADKVDVIYAIATPAVQTAKRAVAETTIPIVFNAVSDPVVVGLIVSQEVPGNNMTGVSDAPPLEKQLALIKEMLPEAQRVGIIINTGEINSQQQLQVVKQLAPVHDLEIVDRGINNQSELALVTERLAQEVDAFYIINDNMTANAASLITGFGNAAKIPTFMAESGQFEQGIFATESISYQDLGRQASEQIIKIAIEGLAASSISVVTATTTKLWVSEAVAERLGLEIVPSVKERAELK